MTTTRMWRFSLVLVSALVVAAPAAAQVQVEGEARAGGGGRIGGGGDGFAEQGFLMGARLVVDSPGSTLFVGGFGGGGGGGGGVLNLTTVDLIPRYYLGYRLGKLGFLVGFHLASTNTDPEGGGESGLFMLALAPQVLYEIVASRTGVALDLFAGPALGFGNQENAGANDDVGIFGFGLDAGVRAIGYILAGLGVHADVGFHLAFLNAEDDGEPADQDEIDYTVVGFYGAIGVMGTM